MAITGKKGIKKSDLKLSPGTIAKLSKNSNINTDTTGKTKEEIVEETKKGMPDFVENMKNSNFDFGKRLEAYKNQRVDKE